MAYTEVRGGAIRVRYKLADGTYGTQRENPETGEPWEDEDEARDWGRDEEVLIRRGVRKAAEEAELPPTFEEFSWAWYRGLRLQPSTMAKYRSLLQSHLLHRFGDRRMQVKEWPSEEFDGWEMDMIRVRYKRSTAAAARNLLVNIINAAIPRYMGFNPAERRAGTGMKGLRRLEAAAQGAKVWPSPLQALLAAERCALLAQHDDVFLQMVTKAWTGLRWSELLALQPDKLLRKQQLLDINQKLYELKGFYLNHPKDGSVRQLDVPPFLWAMLVDQTERARTCPCESRDERDLPPVDGEQVVEWCGGGRRYLFLSEEGAHFQRGNFGTSIMRPAADGYYPARKGKFARPALPVLADAAVYGPKPERGRRQALEREQHWPGRPTLWKWPQAVKDEVFLPPVGRGIPDWGSWPERERPHLVTWLPLLPGLTPHGMRHAHQTWMDDGGIKKALKVQRMGHEDATMQGRYGHPTPGMRVELVDLLQALWENAVAERFKIYPYSAIPLLDAELAKWRQGTADKVISQISPRHEKRAAS